MMLIKRADDMAVRLRCMHSTDIRIYHTYKAYVRVMCRVSDKCGDLHDDNTSLQSSLR